VPLRVVAKRAHRESELMQLKCARTIRRSDGPEVVEPLRSCWKQSAQRHVASLRCRWKQLVMRWRRLDCALVKSKAALRLRPNPPQMKPEPFGIMIFCTAGPKTVDGKTRSKWSRVLRYAARTKPEGQHLIFYQIPWRNKRVCAQVCAPKRRP
jgi:hypothetical protein